MRILPLWLSVFVLLSGCTRSEEFTGRVVSVSDGDTLTVLVNGREQRKVRLHGIDALELKQDFGSRAKQALSQLAFRHEVRVVARDVDRYGRTVADVYRGEQWLNLALVERGMAWVYRRYTGDPKLLAAEGTAKAAHTALWRDKRAVPPWEWRSSGATRR